MKKYILFGCGIIVGIILTISFNYVTSSSKASDNKNIVYFEEAGDIVDEEEFMVIQVLADNAALVIGKNRSYETYLLINGEGKYYYDHEIVKVPTDMVVRHIGMFHYLTNKEKYSTVRVVSILGE